MISRRFLPYSFLICLFLIIGCTATTHLEASAAPMTDEKFFDKIDLDQRGLANIRRAVNRGNMDLAKKELAKYYRNRTGIYHYIDGRNPAKTVSNPNRFLRSARDLVNRTGAFDASLWTNDSFDWERAEMRRKERMYFFESYGYAAAVEDGNEIATALTNLIRSFANQFHAPSERKGGMWATMNIGIRMRTGWPAAFLSLLQSPAFTDEELVLFLKSTWDQTDFLSRNLSDTSNWLTFELAGLYTSGVVYPEFKDAENWRKIACETALNDLDRGWLPDGMTIELSPGYGRFFSNYFIIYDLAKHVGRLDEFGFDRFPQATEPLYEVYLKIMTPDRLAPTTNDNGETKVADILGEALEYFPERDDFRWAVTDGAEGTEPAFDSILLPYAGFAAMRSGWGRRDHLLYFDFGHVGYRHAHQDGLNLILWSHGRQILFDPGLINYDHADPMVNYAMDTFSHNTVLVDNRPQRRNWYRNPHPARMPYEEVPGYRWESTDEYDFVAGIYDGAYGLPGPSNAYPYLTDSNFRQGWSHPAKHHRRVLFWKPDVFIISDTLIALDGEAHEYDVRWHLDTPHAQIGADGFTAATRDQGMPNLEIVPLFTDKLEVRLTSAQKEPELLGWNAGDPKNVTPATTLQHIRSGTGSTSFLTLLLPLDVGQETRLKTWEAIDETRIHIELIDGRKLLLQIPPDPSENPTITTLREAD